MNLFQTPHIVFNGKINATATLENNLLNHLQKICGGRAAQSFVWLKNWWQSWSRWSWWWCWWRWSKWCLGWWSRWSWCWCLTRMAFLMISPGPGFLGRLVGGRGWATPGLVSTRAWIWRKIIWLLLREYQIHHTKYKIQLVSPLFYFTFFAFGLVKSWARALSLFREEYRLAIFARFCNQIVYSMLFRVHLIFIYCK